MRFNDYFPLQLTTAREPLPNWRQIMMALVGAMEEAVEMEEVGRAVAEEKVKVAEEEEAAAAEAVEGGRQSYFKWSGRIRPQPYLLQGRVGQTQGQLAIHLG